MKPEVRIALVEMLTNEGWVRNENQQRDATIRFSRPDTELFATIRWGEDILVLGQRYPSEDERRGSMRMIEIQNPGNHRPDDLKTIIALYRS